MFDDFTFERLVACVGGELSKKETAEFEARLGRNPEEKDVANYLREVIATMRRDDTCDPSPGAIARVIAAFVKSRPAEEVGGLAEVCRFIASLVYDSRVQPAVAGFRGGIAGTQLCYESEPADVDLQISSQDPPHHNITQLRGQVTMKDGSQTAQVALISSRGERPVVETASDERGQFQLSAPPGTYDLRIHMDSGMVLVPTLELE